jgi:heat-inducible transcriptional repressor
MGLENLSPRAHRLLAALVREYIATGEPVPSQTLAREAGLGVSSATIRAELAHLEAAGYLHQPHTSAGRVPTDRGYRVFVDQVLDTRRPVRPPAEVEQQLRQQAERSPLVDDLLAGVSHVVARAARHVGFAIARTDAVLLQRIEFIRLEGSRVLVVVVAQGNHVTQKVVDAGEVVSPDDLVHAANYLNREFAGIPLSEIRTAVLARLELERTLYDELMTRALRLARNTLDALPDLDRHTFHVDGMATLLEAAAQEGVPLATLSALVELMEEKERMVRLLNEYIDGPSFTVVIGGEHTAPNLRSFSLVASTTSQAGAIRTVGLIGPTRMHYSRAISIVDGVTQAVSNVLRAS